MDILSQNCEHEIEISVPQHHLPSLLMPIGDPRDGFFYPTLMIDSNRSVLLFSIFDLPDFFLVFVGKFEHLGVSGHTSSVDEAATKVTGQEGEV